MNIKKKTQEELEAKIKSLEDFIAKKGIGSGYLSKVEKAQRNVNVLLFLGVTVTVIGLTAWMLSGKDKDED